MNSFQCTKCDYTLERDSMALVIIELCEQCGKYTIFYPFYE